ncbi:MAG: YafY family transcriptional regulator [Ignavibacteriaceae bacterium]|jgi:predicted DNA-binding transcriptional regulator YafY|nr:YafY family transcriptional regulator [Ignavibacteriaceae bacterium]
MRIDRMLGIVVVLLNRDRISAKSLADRFEVSVRTIYRDIESINLAGIPVVAYAGNNGGFGIMENYRLDRQVLTLQDMTSILTALKGVSPTFENNDLENVTEKILSLVPDNKMDILKQKFEELCIDILPWGLKQKPKEYLKEIQPAISQKKLISFDYMNMKGEFANRTVEPMTLVYKGYAWYLFAFCRTKNDYRIFKLIRMKNYIVQEEEFERKNQSYHEYMKKSIDESKLVNLVLRYAPKLKTQVEEYFEDDNIEYNSDGSMIVRIALPDDNWLHSTILSSGEHVEVLEPASLRKIIKEKAEKILRVYKHDIQLSQP